jgi:hypothetical protein
VSQLHVRAALRAARRFLTASAIAAVIAIPGGVPVAAHGELVFQLGAERAAPGDVVEVRGDLGAGSTVEIVLISTADGTRHSIATLTDFEEGHFQAYVTIPADQPAGDYLVEAGTESIAVRAPLTIAGFAAVEGGARPNQDEPLLAPLPSGWPGYALESPAAGDGLGPVVDGGGRDALPLPAIFIALLVVLAPLVLLGGLRLAARARSSAG